ncbi:MAG: hypothetical protein BroJett013_22930 [Alphaproteobacteria bacterium]|nr:MAG: hypothetical protein BroJett013_22930 [Alphaproteobacteria bacterium]
MNDAADTYVQTLERLQAGAPLSSIPTDELTTTATGVAVDVAERLGRLNRFVNAREALERAGEFSGDQRARLVRIVAIREDRGASLSADHEALLAINAAAMLATMNAELERRNSAVN